MQKSGFRIDITVKKLQYSDTSTDLASLMYDIFYCRDGNGQHDVCASKTNNYLENYLDDPKCPPKLVLPHHPTSIRILVTTDAQRVITIHTR